MLGSDEVTHLASDQLVGVFTVSSNNGHKNITALYTTLATISVAEDLPTGKVLQATRNVTSLFFVSHLRSLSHVRATDIDLTGKRDNDVWLGHLCAPLFTPERQIPLPLR